MMKLAGALAAAVCLAPPATAGECFRFGDIVTLRGQYAAAVSPRVDGIVRDIRTDAGRLADILTLDAPLCVSADVLSAGVVAAMSVQVRCVVEVTAGVGEVSLTGRLVGARLSNGHTPVLLVCQLP
jgi:hypothetical protein